MSTKNLDKQKGQWQLNLHSKDWFVPCWNACRFYGEKFGNDTHLTHTHTHPEVSDVIFSKTFPSETSRRGHGPNFLGNGFPGFDGVKVPGIPFWCSFSRLFGTPGTMGPPIQNEWIYLYTQHIGQQLLAFTTTLWQTYSYLNFLTATLHNYWLGTFCSLFLVPHVAFSEVCTMPQRSLCVMKLRRMKCRLETQLASAFFPKQSAFTPPKFNMELERKSPEKEVPLGNHHFQVPC